MLEPGLFGCRVLCAMRIEVARRVQEELLREAAVEVEVVRFAGLGVQEAHAAGDFVAPVAALGHVLGVSEPLGHEFVECFGVLLRCEPSALRARGETEVGQRRRDNVESDLARLGIGERLEELGRFEEITGPAMDE